MPAHEAPCVELGRAPQTGSAFPSPSPSEISSASSPEPQHIRPTPLFRALAMPPPDPVQPPGQDELELRLPGYRRIVIPRDLTLIELLKQSSGVTTDEEVLRIREAKLRVVAERVGLRRLDILAPRLRSLTLDGSALSSLRDLGIGLVHLKFLSINRCGLYCLDGVWGLSALRELHAAGNRLQDLHALAALQKMHTLNLADNPIADSSRVWTLAVCGSLRRLTLRGTPASDPPDYRSLIGSVLPMLVFLDDQLLHEDIDDETEGIFGGASSCSDSDIEAEVPASQSLHAPAETQSGPSQDNNDEEEIFEDLPDNLDCVGDSLSLKSDDVGPKKAALHRHRPATTEGAGLRPLRPNLPPRPKTAHERSNVDPPSRLQILNSLMDEEWRCSGSQLTSHGAVCGNLARALRGPTAHVRRQTPAWLEEEAEKELVQQTMEEATRAFADEIPRAPRLEDWARFREETGIEIDIDFNSRPTGDPLSAIERLERIEKETLERLNEESNNEFVPPPKFNGSMTIMSDYERWRNERLAPRAELRSVDDLFNDISFVGDRLLGD